MDQDTTTPRSVLSRAVAAGRCTPISIGPDCTASVVIDDLGLRLAAYPFDWLNSSSAMVEDCLDDDFAAFLDPRLHEQRSKRQSDHVLYRDRYGLKAIFSHHAMPASLDHFQRAVARFREAPAPVFVLVSTMTPPDMAAIARLRSKLRGPVLAYAFLGPDAEELSPNDITSIRMTSKWRADNLRQELESAGLHKRLERDILAAAELTDETLDTPS